ncbi:LutC/YkgG family protein [Nitriliruptor alkaliphilus]|uniref:LutC/YkgG family protein n=1 Tax=Nitriliruptor alkaliphilus TaxID=427918 RepID=UPI000696F20E|nr:LUD domain-containing protein [Nitriliruptor alkaliphilus]
MTARDEVLARIRSALGPAPAAPDVPREYRGQGSDDGRGRAALLDLLVDRLEDYKATVVRVDVGGVIDAVTSGLGDAATVVVPPGLLDAWLPTGPRTIRDDGLDAEALDQVDAVVTGATVAVADTGTIVLDGSPDQGRRAITLVPDLHVCIVAADQVVATVPDALARLDPTRPQTWISGPSATSDIELNRVEGVHGPRRLVVVLVDGDA